ncbi:MAG: aspartyl protease family protein [bacterium]|nr:MAG: aspartyl protease family protein [bacterium]
MKNRLISIAVLFTALAWALSAPGSGGVEELLRKHLEALGGESAIRSLHSIITTAEIEFRGTGLNGTMTSYYLEPCLSYSEISIGLFEIKHGYDGERIWMVDPNGKLQIKRDPGSVEDQVSTCIIESYSYLFPGGDAFRLLAAGQDTVEGTLCEVIELIPTGGNRCLLYLDSSSHLLRRVTTESRQGRIEQTFSDYRAVAGVMLPYTTCTHHAALNQTIVARADSISVNTPIDPVLFLPPPGDVKDYRFTEGPAAERMHFLYRFQHIYLPVKLAPDAPDEIFLLDSGAGMTVIDSTLAAMLELPSGGTLTGLGAGGVANFSMTRIPALYLRGVEFSTQSVISYPLTRFRERFTDIEFTGILGYDFLSRFTTHIDFEGKTISLYEPDSTPPSPSDAVIDAPLIHNILSFTGRVNGSHSGTFLLDTGANSSVLRKEFVKEHDLADPDQLPRIAVIGAGGREEVALRRFDSFEVGGIVIEQPVFAIAREPAGIGAFDGISGIIGNDILERFTVILDYKHQKIHLSRNGMFDEPFFKDKCGLQIMRSADSRVLIILVVAGSPAEKAGLKVGDEIVAVDGQKIEKFLNLEEILRSFQAKDGVKRTLTIRRAGVERTVPVTLERYI